jgi:hypothetical protein
MANAFGGVGPKDPPARYLANNFVRLVVASVSHYQAARGELQLYREQSNIPAYFRGVAFFESCLLNTDRAILHAVAMRSQGLQSAAGEPLMPRPKELEVLTDPVISQIRRFRHEIAHFEKRVLAGMQPGAGPIASPPTMTGVTLGGYNIQYEDIARWLRQLYDLAKRIHAFEDSSW